MKRLRGAISSQSFRRRTSSTNAMAARDVSTPTTMPSTAIDAIRAAVLNPARMDASVTGQRARVARPAAKSMDSRLRGNDGRGARDWRVRRFAIREWRTPMDSRLRGNDEQASLPSFPRRRE